MEPLLQLTRRFLRLTVGVCMFAVLFACLPPTASADIGPKPEMDVSVYYDGQPLPYEQYEAAILVCNSRAANNPGNMWRSGPSYTVDLPRVGSVEVSNSEGCAWGPPIMPVRVLQDGDGGLRITYMIPSTFRLAFHLPANGKTYLTPPAERRAMRTKFRVDLANDGTASIRSGAQGFWESDWRWEMALVALPATLAIELGIVLLWSRRIGLPLRKLARVGIRANLLSLPVLWTTVLIAYGALGGWPAFVTFLVLEVLVVFFEGWLYSRTQLLSRASAISLAAIANLASFGFGLMAH